MRPHRSPAEETAAVLRQATSAIPVPIPGAFERRVGRIRPTAVSGPPSERTHEKRLSRIAHVGGGRLHRLNTGSHVPMTVTYRGVASISLVVLMVLVFSEPVMSGGAIATLVGTSFLAATTVVVVTRLARKSLAAVSDEG